MKPVGLPTPGNSGVIVAVSTRLWPKPIVVHPEDNVVEVGSGVSAPPGATNTLPVLVKPAGRDRVPESILIVPLLFTGTSMEAVLVRASTWITPALLKTEAAVAKKVLM